MVTDPIKFVYTVGDGVTTDFSYAYNGTVGFDADVAEDVRAAILNPDGTRDTNPNFAVLKDTYGNFTGAIRFATAPMANAVVYIYRATPQTQETEYKTSSGFDAKNVENDFDKLTKLVQETSSHARNKTVQLDMFQENVLKFILASEVNQNQMLFFDFNTLTFRFTSFTKGQAVISSASASDDKTDIMLSHFTDEDTGLPYLAFSLDQGATWKPMNFAEISAIVNSANAKAQEALDNSETAVSTSNDAKAIAQNAATDAENAVHAATNATDIANVANATAESAKTTATNAAVAVAGKQDIIPDLATIRAGAAEGATAVQPAAIADMETKTHAASTYQPKGDYATSTELATGLATKADTTTTDTLRNDVDGLGDQVHGIEEKIPAKASATNQLATMIDIQQAGGLSEVLHDDTMTGNGTSASPLSVKTDDFVKKSATEMQTLSSPLTIKDEICLTDPDDNIAKHSLSIVAGVPTETAAEMDIIGNRKYDILPTTDDATAYTDLNPKSMITKGQVASAISTKADVSTVTALSTTVSNLSTTVDGKADTTTTDTLRNDVDGLGDQVQEIETKIPGDATASNQLATKADLANKQDKLVSGTNIKTVNGESLLGSGDVKIDAGGAMPVGAIFTTPRTGTIQGAVEANGSPYNIADYSGEGSIGALLTAGSIAYVSKTEFQTRVANTGACDSFGWDGASDTTFLVPKLNPWHVGKNAPVVGNGNNIGWTDGTTEYAGVGQTYTGTGITGIFGTDETKTLPASGTGQGYQPSNNTMYGLSTDPTKSGVIADLTETTNLRVMVQLATGATDQALETCTSVLADVSALKDASNFTATGKETVVGWGMPDYSAIVTWTCPNVGETYTMPYDGELRFSDFNNGSGLLSLAINGIRVVYMTSASNLVAATGSIRLKKGTVITVVAKRQCSDSYLIPLTYTGE